MSQDKSETAMALLKAAEITGTFHARLLALTGEAMNAYITPLEISERFEEASRDFHAAMSKSASGLEDALSREILLDRDGNAEPTDNELTVARLNYLHSGVWKSPAQTSDPKSDGLDMSIQLLDKRLKSFCKILSEVDSDLAVTLEHASGTVNLVHGDDHLDDLIAAYGSDADGNPSGFIGLISRNPTLYGMWRAVLKDGEIPGRGTLFTLDALGARDIAAAYSVVKSVYR